MLGMEIRHRLITRIRHPAIAVIVEHAIRHRDVPGERNRSLPMDPGGGAVVRTEHAGDAQQSRRPHDQQDCA